MAQDGDTITYTFSDGTVVSEDVSNVDTAVVDYCDGSGANVESSSGSGGRVENAEIDVSGQNTLYLWVGGVDSSISKGRYKGGEVTNTGGPSTEISFSNTDSSDSADEPFLIGAGGGGGAGTGLGKGSGGARGGAGDEDAEGTAPPLGGDGKVDSGTDGEGAIDDQNRGLVSGGTTITGGGSVPDSNGEIQVSYKQSLSPPDPPSNLTAEQQ